MADVLRSFDWNWLYQRLILAVAALLSLSFHELSHGFVSYKLGDSTAKTMGRLTLNPLRHIDVFGFAAFILAGFGWAKPVMIDPRNLKHPKRDMAITALAGPVSNFVLAIIFLFILGLVKPFLVNNIVSQIIYDIILGTASLSIVLGVFNLIPVPPLDGSKILFAVASDQLYYKLMRFERYGFILLLLVILWNGKTNFIGIASGAVMSRLYVITQVAEKLMMFLLGR